MNRKEIFLVVFLLVFGFVYYFIHEVDFGFIQGGRPSFESTRLASESYFEFLLPEASFSGVTQVTVINPAGSVWIEPSGDSQVHCRATARIYWRSRRQAEKLWKSFVLSREAAGGELQIHAGLNTSFPFNRLRVQIEIQVPEAMRIAVDNGIGLFRASHIAGSIELRQNLGRAELEGIRGDVRLDCRYVKIEARDVSGQLSIAGSYCDVAVARARILEAQTHFGTLEVEGIDEKAVLKKTFGRIAVSRARDVAIDAQDASITARDVKNSLQIRDRNERIELERIEGNVRIFSTNCPVVLRDCRGDLLDIRSSIEDVRVEGYRGVRAYVQVKNCGLQFRFAAIEDRLEIEARYARVQVEYPAALRPGFDIAQRHGSITGLDLPAEAAGRLQEQPEFLQKIQGKPEIVLRSEYSDIVLKKY